MGYITYAILAVRKGSLTGMQKTCLIGRILNKQYDHMFRGQGAGKWYDDVLKEFAEMIKGYPITFYLLCTGEDDNDNHVTTFKNGVITRHDIKLPPWEATPMYESLPRKEDVGDDEYMYAEEDANILYQNYRDAVLESHLKLWNLEEISIRPFGENRPTREIIVSS